MQFVTYNLTVIYCSSTQWTAPQVHFLAVVHVVWCRDGNSSTAINSLQHTQMQWSIEQSLTLVNVGLARDLILKGMYGLKEEWLVSYISPSMLTD